MRRTTSFICPLHLDRIELTDLKNLLIGSLNFTLKCLPVTIYTPRYLDIAFNVKKSMIIRIGQAFRHVCNNVTPNGLDLPFVEDAKYLGVFILTGKRFRVNLSEPISKFFKSVNSILSKCKGHMNEVVLLNLLSAYCKPLLCYAYVNVLIFWKVNILAYSMPGTVFTGNFCKSMIKIVLVISAGFQVLCRYQLILI